MNNVYLGRNYGGDVFSHETLPRLQNLLTMVDKICHSRNEVLQEDENRGLFSLSRVHLCIWIESKCHLIASDGLQRVRVKMMVHVLIA